MNISTDAHAYVYNSSIMHIDDAEKAFQESLKKSRQERQQRIKANEKAFREWHASKNRALDAVQD